MKNLVLLILLIIVIIGISTGLDRLTSLETFNGQPAPTTPPHNPMPVMPAPVPVPVPAPVPVPVPASTMSSTPAPVPVSTTSPSMLASLAAAGPAIYTVSRSATPPSVCPDNSPSVSGLCYPPCHTQPAVQAVLKQNPSVTFNGNTPICQPNCPAGFIDRGTYCDMPPPYNQTGRAPNQSCPPGWNLRAFGSSMWCDNAPQIPLLTRPLVSHCQPSEFMCNGSCYAKCKTGFHSANCNMCAPDCPIGFTNANNQCLKNSYAGSNGQPARCYPGQDMIAGGCYTSCHNVPAVQAALKSGMYKNVRAVGQNCQLY